MKIKPTMSMFITVDDLNAALVKWYESELPRCTAEALYEVETLLRYEYEGAYNSSDIGKFFDDVATARLKELDK